MRFSKGLVLALALLLVAGLTATAFAQEQTGGIQGVVKDSSGAVLPGVTVEARNVSVAGVQTAITDDKGVYRFPALPPGTYEVTATLQGFTPAKVGGAAIVLGKLLTIDLTLAVGGVAESVQVTGEAPLIDVKQNAGFATIQKDTIDRIPKGRDFQTVLKTAPGTQDESRSGGIQVDGASGSENRFVVDGMDTTTLQNGTSGKNMLLDFIQEVQVKSSGYNAEFGGATGGVVSAISKSGTNQLRGSAGTYYNSSDFYGSKRKFNRFDFFNTNLTILNYTNPDQNWTYNSPFFDLGGPIMKDKLWFYAGYSYKKNTLPGERHLLRRPDAGPARLGPVGVDAHAQLQRVAAGHQQPAHQVLGLERSQREPPVPSGLLPGRLRVPGRHQGDDGVHATTRSTRTLTGPSTRRRSTTAG